jgi:DNA-binding beta-propeller fold protein YncE
MSKSPFFSVVFFTIISLTFSVSAQEKGLFVLEKTIALPGNGGFDYLTVDNTNRRLYITHGNSVHVLDLDTEKPLGIIDGLEGVHGVSIVNKVGKGFITDGKVNAVYVFDLESLKIIKKIPLSGKKTDAIMYEPYSNQIVAFNNGSSNAAVIDVNTLEVKKVIELGGAPEFGVSDGKGKFYNNIEDKAHVLILDAKTMTVLDSISLKPYGIPTSLGLDAKNKILFSSCREGSALAVIDLKSNKVIATLPICKGVDALVYDAESKLIYCSGDGTTTIIKQESADKYAVIQTLTTKYKAKTLAFDKKTKKIYISSSDYNMETKKNIPGTFTLMVFKMNADLKQ